MISEQKECVSWEVVTHNIFQKGSIPTESFHVNTQLSFSSDQAIKQRVGLNSLGSDLSKTAGVVQHQSGSPLMVWGICSIGGAQLGWKTWN